MADHNKPSDQDPRTDGDAVSEHQSGTPVDERGHPLRALSGASRDLRKYTHQIWLAGLGAFARAEEEGSGFFDALVEAGREVERRAKDKAPRVGELKERVRHHTGETMDRMEKAFDDRLGKALSRLGIPNKREVDALRQRVQELTDALNHIDKDDQDPPKGRQAALVHRFQPVGSHGYPQAWIKPDKGAPARPEQGQGGGVPAPEKRAARFAFQ